MRYKILNESKKKSIIQLYSIEKKSEYDIAKKYNIAPSTVYYILKNHNVQLRSRSEALKGKLRKNGKTITQKGYVLLFRPEHPFSWKIGYIRKSRLIIEQYLRENNPNHPALIEKDGEVYLRPEWDVHHVNGIKDDDKIENLEVLEHRKHSKLTFPISKSKGKYIFKKISNHPFLCQNGCIKRSRLIMEQKLRKYHPNHPALIEINGINYLRNGWIVHHINRIKDDDRSENLEIMTRQEHGRLFFRE